jgi:hypothetical protein
VVYSSDEDSEDDCNDDGEPEDDWIEKRAFIRIYN